MSRTSSQQIAPCHLDVNESFWTGPCHPECIALAERQPTICTCACKSFRTKIVCSTAFGHVFYIHSSRISEVLALDHDPLHSDQQKV